MTTSTGSGLGVQLPRRHRAEELFDGAVGRGLVGPLRPHVPLLEERVLRAIDHPSVLVDDGGLGRDEERAAAARLDLAHRLAVVRLAAEEQDRLVAIAHGRGMERVKALRFQPQGEHRDDDLLHRARRPWAAERHPLSVVGDALGRVAVPHDVGGGPGHLGRDLNIGQAVVEEVLVGQGVTHGLRAVDIDPQPGRPRDELLR